MRLATGAPRSITALLALLVLLLTACTKPFSICLVNGCSDPLPKFGSFEPSVITLKPGESETVKLHLLEHRKAGPYRFDTSLPDSSLPYFDNLHFSIDPNPVPADVRLATVTVTLDEDATPFAPPSLNFPAFEPNGTYPVATADLTINRPPAAVSISDDSYYLYLNRTPSETRNLRLHRELADNYDGPVFFEAALPPAVSDLGMTVSINPNPVTGDETTVTFRVSKTLPVFYEAQWATVIGWRGSMKTAVPFDPLYHWPRFNLFDVAIGPGHPSYPPGTGTASNSDPSG